LLPNTLSFGTVRVGGVFLVPTTKKLALANKPVFGSRFVLNAVNEGATVCFSAFVIWNKLA
jgi:hypothetical protein